jgi:tetratricopeptide (TPR) repeat protein
MRLFENIFKNKGIKDVLKDVDIKEIKEEIGYLELQEKKLETQRQELEKEVQRLFQESIGKSEATKRLNATKISNLQQRIKDIDKDLREIILRLGVLYKIQRLKEKALKIYNSKLWEKLINNVDSETLERLIVHEQLSEDEILEKLEQLYNAKEPVEKAEEISPEEKEILDLMEEVEKGVKSPEEAAKEVNKEKDVDEEKETQ